MLTIYRSPDFSAEAACLFRKRSRVRVTREIL